jgi:hypothetical protein
MTGKELPVTHSTHILFRATRFTHLAPEISRAKLQGEVRGLARRRLPPPALISRTPSSTSCQTFRFASKRARAGPVSFLFIFTLKRPSQSFKTMAGNVILSCFGAVCQCCSLSSRSLADSWPLAFMVTASPLAS